MIVKMKKLTLLCTRASREATLAALRDLGVVHLQPVQPPEGADLDEARNLFDHLKRALEVLPKHPHVKPSGKKPYDTVKAVWELIHRKQALSEQLEALELEIRHYEPFGSFSPESVRDLRARGVAVKLYKAPIKETPAVPVGAQRIELSRDRSTVYFVLLGLDGLSMDAEEVPLPGSSLAEMKARREELKNQLIATEGEFGGYAGDHAAISVLADEADDRIRYLEARTGMGGTEEVVYLRGFFPAEQSAVMRTEAVKKGWAVLIEEPSADDPVPTLLRNPKWVRPIQAVFKMIGVAPAYHEVDISALFLIFFSIFFAMLVGDAGYGALFILLTVFGKLRFRKAPQEVFNLLLITSVCTVVWGILTGSYFGLSDIPAPLKKLRLGWLTGPGADKNIMLLCFLLGTVHLTIAHAWNTFRMIRTWQALAQIGWIGSTWTMFFAARTLVLGAAFPPVMIWVLAVSVVLIVLFMNPVEKIKSEWFNYVILPLNIVSNFVDVVSYVRLFAVGAASFALANAFNQMAMDVGFGGVLSGLGAALILFFSHLLNILLSAMGVMVHGVRLNTLEFSGHIGVQWAGRRYNPFRKISATDV
jgi:V/A-type H+-transporting ATPase subunit I